jgi:hypothetical protein
MIETGAGKDIPKAQRRGAIVILGMIAVARQKVVTERIDTLLNVGLGPLGKVRIPFYFLPYANIDLTLHCP